MCNGLLAGGSTCKDGCPGYTHTHTHTRTHCGRTCKDGCPGPDAYAIVSGPRLHYRRWSSPTLSEGPARTGALARTAHTTRCRRGPLCRWSLLAVATPAHPNPLPTSALAYTIANRPCAPGPTDPVRRGQLWPRGKGPCVCVPHVLCTMRQRQREERARARAREREREREKGGGRGGTQERETQSRAR